MPPTSCYRVTSVLNDATTKPANSVAIKSLDLYADDISSRYCLAIMLNYLKEHADARNEWFKLLQQPDLAEELRPTVLNNIAWVNLFMGDADLLLEADLYSLEALQSMPDSPPFKGTRGSVLIELGNVEEGLPFVRAALAGNETPQFKALNLCYIAVEIENLGTATEAIQARSEAHKLDPDCILLEKVDQRLAANQAAIGNLRPGPCCYHRNPLFMLVLHCSSFCGTRFLSSPCCRGHARIVPQHFKYNEPLAAISNAAVFAGHHTRNP